MEGDSGSYNKSERRVTWLSGAGVMHRILYLGGPSFSNLGDLRTRLSQLGRWRNRRAGWECTTACMAIVRVLSTLKVTASNRPIAFPRSWQFPGRAQGSAVDARGRDGAMLTFLRDPDSLVLPEKTGSCTLSATRDVQRGSLEKERCRLASLGCPIQDGFGDPALF